MSLRKKTLLLGSITIISLLAILYGLSRAILMTSFARLETESVQKDVARVLDALDAEGQNLGSSVTDSSAWDEEYAFVAGQNPTFSNDYYQVNDGLTLRVNLIVLRSCTGEILINRMFDLKNKQQTLASDDLLSRLEEDGFFACGADPHQIKSGVLLTEKDPMLAAAHLVLTSDYQGPANAVLIFGRNLDTQEVQRLADVTHLPVQLSNPAVEGMPSDQEVQVQPLNSATIRGLGLVKDLQGKPALVLRMDLPRQIYHQGQLALTYLLWSLLAVGLVFTVVMLFPLENLLLRRMSRLSRAVETIGVSSDRHARLEAAGNDELSRLAVEINRMLEGLEEAEQKLLTAERRNILNAIPDLLFILTRTGKIVEVKSERKNFFKLSLADLPGKTIREFGFSNAYLSVVEASIERACATGEPQTFEFEFHLEQSYFYEFRLVALRADEVLAIARDITERKNAEATLLEQNEALRASQEALQISAEALQESEERYSLAVQGANDGLWDWDLKTNQIYFSPRWKAMLGYAAEEISTSPDEWLSRVHPEDLDQVRLALSKHLRGLMPHFEIEHRILHKDGSYRWELMRGLAVWETVHNPVSLAIDPADGHGTAGEAEPGAGPLAKEMAVRMAGSMSDITARKVAEEQLLHDAFYDALTGLPNRALLVDRLSHAIDRTNRHSESSFVVFFLDLDRFKVINDSLGHAVGDQLLIAVANRLRSIVRSADTVARLGGDEFVILVEENLSLDKVTQLADRIQAEIKQPFQLSGHEVVVTESLGVVSDTRSYIQPNEVLRDADIAMYRAKANGKDRFEIFDVSLRSRAIARLELESELREAMEKGELYLNYQPIMSLEADQLNGFEALLRWKSPTRGQIPPMEFIPVAEETGLIIPIGAWVLREACRQMKEWQQIYPMDPPLSISVNISGIQFEQPAFVDRLVQILDETGFSPRFLKLEITESVLMANAAQANAVLMQLRDLGIQLMIDDFGTGYSSLAYLQHFPIHTIKIDRSFVSEMEKANNQEDVEEKGEIVHTIIALARDLGMDAVAEGIETLEQFQKLKQLHCQYGQGYFLARPLDGRAAAAFIAHAKEPTHVSA